MGAPPADADPADYIIGRKHYDNLQIATVVSDPLGLRIEPRPLPRLSLALQNLVFLAIGCAMAWAFTRDGNDPGWFPIALILGITIGTCLLVTLVTIHRYRSEHNAGTWLIYRQADQTVSLPRIDRHLQRSEIDHLECITTMRLQRGDSRNNPLVSELNLVLHKERERLPLLQTTRSRKPFAAILAALHAQTGLPIEIVRGELVDWGVTREPYRP